MTFGPDSRNAPDPPTRRLTWLYIAALSFVAALSIAGQILTQRSIARQLDDSRIVNLAGRQRMLSQRLTQLALRLDREEPSEGVEATKRQFAESLAVWTETHEALRHGSDGLAIPENDSAVVAEMFDRLDASYLPMKEAGETILDSLDASPGEGEVARREATAVLLAQESAFLGGMDAIVFQYDAEARARVASLRLVEAALLLATLATLAAEGLLVFRPAVAQLRRYVTEMRQKNEELAAAERRAVEASQAKTRFLANMSHELRTPMNAVLGASEIAHERTSDESLKRLMAAMRRSAKSLLAMMNDLLDLSQIDAGARLSLRTEPFDPVAASADLAELYRPTAERKGLFVRCVTSGEQSLRALGDEDRFRQILSNLLSNAIKFTDVGGVEVRVDAKKADDERIDFVAEVIDTGIGVPAESRQRIFDRFAQADSGARRRAGGAGLGLAIVADLVREMDGSIELEASSAQGSRFVVRLPFRPATLSQEMEASVVSAADERPGQRFDLRVLIADDSETNRLLLSERLADLGCTVRETADGREALRLATTEPFDAVLLDVDMPEIDGNEVARELRSRIDRGSSRPRLIAVTAYSADEAREACLRSGFDGFLGKPLDRDALVRELNSASAIRGSRSASHAFASSESPAATVLRRFAGREALLERLVAVYFDESDGLARRLASACEANDREAGAEVLHRWKGACSHFGWAPATAAFDAVEREWATNDELPALALARLRATREELERALRALVPVGEEANDLDPRPT